MEELLGAFGNKDWSRVETLAREMLEHPGCGAIAYHTLALAAEAQCRPREAEDLLLRAMEFDPFRRVEGAFRLSAPAVDLVEREKEYVVTAELPGLDEKALEVKLSGDTLTIRGRKEEEHKEERENYRMSERRFGSFQRSLRLPQDVDSEKIDAQFAKGVLTVTLPKSEETLKKQKKIDVKSG